MIKTDKNKTDGKCMAQAEIERIQLQTAEGGKRGDKHLNHGQFKMGSSKIKHVWT